ncbi:hypothetical protein [Pseudooceanicola sp.]|uniref:hypothetical protein n=1 Tax=Pseudooceanicola sp. TaxID=1914328 RepID=UPI00262CB329|nr:hypothetical protein [Pseudooceanicola sp.]MDF1854112.1 hypothetical protein [Pseudooceanicola sp.]
MLVIIGAVLGALFGGWRARSRGGKTVDVLQYAVVHAMILALGSLFLTLFLHRALI